MCRFVLWWFLVLSPSFIVTFNIPSFLVLPQLSVVGGEIFVSDHPLREG